MPGFPDANSGGLDPTGAAKPKPPLSRRIRAWAILLALCAGILGLAVAAVPMLHSVFRPGLPLDDRGLHLFYAVGLLLPLGLILKYFIATRIKTGRWQATPEQRKQEREQRRAQCPPSGACGTRKSTWTHYAVQWATCNAMDRAQLLPRRIAAWTVLALYAASMLVSLIFGVLCICMAFGVDDHPASFLVLLIAGVAMLAYPGTAIASLVRGIRAGKIGATREDVEQIRAQRSARHQREWQRPLRSKITSIAISCVVVAFLWMRVTLHHAQHPHQSWITPAIATVPLFYSIWLQFRRPKNASPPDDGSTTIDAS